MATSYEASGLYLKAVECYQIALVHNSTNTDAQLQLAVLCQELGIPNVAPVGSKNVVSTRNPTWQHSKKSNRIKLGEASPMRRSSLTMIAPRTSFRHLKRADIKRSLMEEAKERDSYALFIRMETFAKQAQEGDDEFKAQWMVAAKQLIETFQSERAFFPYEKYMRFYGYTKEARKKSLNSKVELGSREYSTTNNQLISCSGEFT